jgi:hypothetical protein
LVLNKGLEVVGLVLAGEAAVLAVDKRGKYAFPPQLRRGKREVLMEYFQHPSAPRFRSGRLPSSEGRKDKIVVESCWADTAAEALALVFAAVPVLCICRLAEQERLPALRSLVRRRVALIGRNNFLYNLQERIVEVGLRVVVAMEALVLAWAVEMAVAEVAA